MNTVPDGAVAVTLSLAARRDMDGREVSARRGIFLCRGSQFGDRTSKRYNL